MFYFSYSPSVDEAVRKNVENTLPSTDKIASSDALLILGGDGTLLTTLQSVKYPPIIYAVNFGSCGILMPFNRDDLPSLIENLRNKKAFPTFKRKRPSMNGAYFLNETIVTKNLKGRLNKYKIFINDELFKEVSGDSVIVSTPAGSSAYNLSAGGPFVDYDCDVLIITVVSPFRSFYRSMVVNASKKITISGGELCIMDGCKQVECSEAMIEFDGNVIEFGYFESETQIEKVMFDKIFNRKK